MPRPPEIELVSESETDTYEPRAKNVSLVDLNLLQGSSDRFRNSLGGFFFNQLDKEGNHMVPPPFYKFLPLNNPNETIYSVVSYKGQAVNSAILGYTDATAGVAQRGFGSGFEQERPTIIPSTQFVCRIEGNPDAQYLNNVLQGSKYWHTLFMGGQFLETTIQSMFNVATYDDHYTTTALPYHNIQKQYLTNASDTTKFIGSTYEYNRHLRRYQNYATTLDTERILPNWYTLNLAAYAYTIPNEDGEYTEQHAESMMDLNTISFYTCNRAIPSMRQLNSVVAPVTDAEIPTVETPSWKIPLTNYLDQTFTNNFPALSASVIEHVQQRNKNLLFNSNAVSALLVTDSEPNENAAALPYYNKINFDTLKAGTYSQIIKDNECSTLFLRAMKEVFLGQAADEVQVSPKQFLQNTKFMSASYGRTADVLSTATETVEYPSVDLIKVLLQIYANVVPQHKDFYVMDYNSVDTNAVYDTRGVYRAYSSRNAIRTINDMLGTFGTATAATDITNVNTLLNSQNKELEYDIDTFGSLQPSSKYNEVVAYRVEKVGGPPTGDSDTQDAIQNFWIFNDSDLDTLNLIDTQIKYDTEYTYTVYAYYVIKGFKYSYSNLQLSRLIGQVRDDGYTGPLEYGSGIEGTPPDPPSAYCIEYYDPFTEQHTEDMLRNVPEIYGAESSTSISSLSTDAQRVAVSSKRSPEGNVLPPYVANFVVTTQPSLKMIEVPLITKKYRTLDNPPNELDVMPAYTLNNTNRLTFDLSYQTFSPHSYPRPVSDRDVEREEAYLHANDLVTDSMIDKESRSVQRIIEVYRLDEKPSSFRDFSSVLPRTISLAIEDSDFSYTTATFDDIVKSNKKYYYLFRAVNENDVAGNVDTIIEAELVNDGGYKYSNFEVLFEQDLEEETFRDTTTQFKKILQLSPNLSQITIDESEASLSEPAKSQYDSVKVGTSNNLIWGKTFKIRLTSKKTGKKIDLNITYNNPDTKLEED